MKNVGIVLGAFLTLVLVSCQGDQGPPGFDGLDGLDGIDGEAGIQAQVFEVEGVNFDYIVADNLYESILTFTDFTSFEVLPNDAVLVYQFDRTVDFEDGGSENVWNLIPQSFFLDQGTIQFISGHTSKDVEILISGNFNLSNLDPGFTDNQIFRIAIVPGVAATSKMDKSNMAAVMSSLGLTEKDVQKIRVK
ncbi:hypothetical protein LCGC14_0789380 [marine sediment metagenome]|uniref:Collagen-like protein n=2 Tax=root TaxID=1 RepID=A0A831VR03_9FLAO|nr:collagen-like protein [Pricia sp.]HEA21228.1 collagen-like protein [Pricia antarctica]